MISVRGYHQTGPAYQRRHAVAAFPIGVLLAAERRCATVWPSKGLGTVVGGVDHDGVVGDAEIVELLEKLTDLAIVLHHAVRVDAQPSLALRLWSEAGPDVHAGRVEPGEERLLVSVGAVDEVERRCQELLIHRLHALLGKRAGVGAALSAPLAETRIFARGLGEGGRAPQDAARTEAQLELQILRIVRVLGLVLGIEVIEKAVELIEAMDRRQKLVDGRPGGSCQIARSRNPEPLQELRQRRVLPSVGRPAIRLTDRPARYGLDTGR